MSNQITRPIGGRKKFNSPSDYFRDAEPLAVYDGKSCIGLVHRRGGKFEACSDELSLGIFADIESAASAVWRHAHRQGPRQ